MSIERLTITALVDTGAADVFGLEGLEPRVVARAYRLVLQEMALPGVTVGATTACWSAEGDRTLYGQLMALTRAERAAVQVERDQAAAAAIADELAERTIPVLPAFPPAPRHNPGGAP